MRLNVSCDGMPPNSSISAGPWLSLLSKPGNLAPIIKTTFIMAQMAMKTTLTRYVSTWPDCVGLELIQGSRSKDFTGP